MNAIALTISNIPVRQDSQGRYCLNDLHKASGGESKHQPAFFIRRDETKELVAELSSANSQIINPVEVIKGKGKAQGTYVVKELVYAYAMWISAKFHIAVIRAYDALVTGKIQSAPEPKTKIAHKHGLTLEMQDEIKSLIKSRVESELPREKWPKASMMMWSAIKSKFGLTKEQSYKDLAPENFAACISLLSRMHLGGELVEQKPTRDAITINLPATQEDEVKRWMVVQSGSSLNVWEACESNLHMAAMMLSQAGYIVLDKNASGVNAFVYNHLPANLLLDLIDSATKRLKAIR